MISMEYHHRSYKSIINLLSNQGYTVETTPVYGDVGHIYANLG